MVEVGGRIARQPPVPVGSTPADLRCTNQILRHRHNAHCTAQTFAVGRHDLHPRRQQSRNAFTNFHRRQFFRWQSLRDFQIDAVDPAIDHRHRAVLIGKTRYVEIDTHFVCSGRHRSIAPTIEGSIAANGRGKRLTDFIERRIGGKGVSNH